MIKTMKNFKQIYFYRNIILINIHINICNKYKNIHKMYSIIKIVDIWVKL